MAIKLGDAFVELFGKRDKLNQDLGQAKEDTRTWTTAVGVMAGNLMTGVITKAADIAVKAVVGLGKSLVDMTLEAAKIEGVRNTFDNLVESIGGDAVNAMEQLRASTRGMVSDADLMQAGNKFLAMGLADSAEKAAELAEVATQLGMAMGGDATSSMENFALMMANQSIPRLDSFGISSSKVRERIEELMAATEGLTREQAFNQAVMEQARVTMAKVGEQGDTAAAGMARITATLENLKLKGGTALQPILDLFVSLGEAILEKYGPKLEAWLDFITGPIENFAGAFKALIDGDINGFLSGINDALVGLGVPQETIDKVNISLSTLLSAFEDLKAGNLEEFIGKIKAVLLEWGVPIDVIDGMEAAFRWLLKAAEDVSKFWEGTLKPAMKAFWENVLQPALEGLWQLLTDLKPLMIAVGGILLLHIALPMLLAALPVIALGAALIALGLLWKEHGEQVKVIVGQIGVIVSYVFSSIIEWVRNAIAAITSIEGPFGDMLRGILGDGQNTLSMLDDVIERMRETNKARAEAVAAQSAQTPQSFNAGEAWEQVQQLFGGSQDNSRSMTNYGGIQFNNNQDTGQALEQLWNLGQT